MSEYREPNRAERRRREREEARANKTSQPRLLVVNDSRDPLADDTTVANSVRDNLGWRVDAVLNSDFLPSVDTAHYTSRLHSIKDDEALRVVADLIDEFCMKMAVFVEPVRLPVAKGAKGYTVPVFFCDPETPTRARAGMAQVWVAHGIAKCVMHIFDDDGVPQPAEALPEDALYVLLSAMPSALRSAAERDGGKRYYKARFGGRRSA
jgi:hypothetical protein